MQIRLREVEICPPGTHLIIRSYIVIQVRTDMTRTHIIKWPAIPKKSVGSTTSRHMSNMMMRTGADS